MVRFGRFQTFVALGIAVLALGIVAVPVAQGQQPIAVSGFNADVIIDTDTTARHSQSYDGNQQAWFEAGAVDDRDTKHDDGIPAGQNVTSATGSGVVYAIQPAGGNNVLRIACTEDGTLTLNTPAPYTSLWVLASSGAGGDKDDVTINYDDGTSHPVRNGYDTGDWCDDSFRGALQGLGRADIGPYGLNFSYLHECSFGIYETRLSPSAGKNVVSLTFHNQNARYTQVWAISGN